MTDFDKWYNENLLKSFGEDYRKMCKRVWDAGYEEGWESGNENGFEAGYLTKE